MTGKADVNLVTSFNVSLTIEIQNLVRRLKYATNRNLTRITT